MWYDNPKTKLKDGLDVVNQTIRDARKESLDIGALEKIELAHGMVEGILTAYFERYIPQDRKTWDVIAVEKTFSFPLKDMPWTAEGKLDLLVREKVGKKKGTKGAELLVEHKTTSVLSEDYVGRLPLDEQIHQYWWGAKLGLDFKFNPSAIIYNVVQKSRLRQKGTESFEEFILRVKAEYLADPTKYFWRGRMVLPTWSRTEYLSETSGIAMHIDEARAHGGREWFYRNTNHCFQFGECPFVPLCTSENPNTVISLYEVKSSPHPELDTIEED